MKIVTIPRGKILWHARWQPKEGGYRNVMESPDYLFMSPQIQQALYHGLDTHRYGTMIQITKLRVKKPLKLVKFETTQEQLNMASGANIEPFDLFSNSNIQLLKKICDMTDIDGWRIVWDQDQIAVCARVIKDKLKVVGGRLYDPNYMPNIMVSFNTRPSRAYYTSTKSGRELVLQLKRSEKAKAAERKAERTAEYQRAGPSMRVVKKIAKKRAAPGPAPASGFKRPVKRGKA